MSCVNSGLPFLADKQVKAELRLTEEEWDSELSDDKSEKYKTLANKIKTVVCVHALSTDTILIHLVCFVDNKSFFSCSA